MLREACELLDNMLFFVDQKELNFKKIEITALTI